MKVRIGAIAIVALLLGAAPARGEGTLTLKESYEKALARSETVAIQEETIRIAEAHYLQALGTVLPHVNVIGTEIIQDTGGGIGGGAGGGSVDTTLTRRSRPEVAVQLVQPLFQGFREFRALKAASAEKRQNKLLTERARQTLFSDVAQAYYTVLEVEQQRDIQNSLRGTLSKRTGELQERIRLGKSRGSELLTTEAEIANVEADLEQTKGLIATSRDYLAFLIGEPVTQKLVDEFKTPAKLPPVTAYIDTLTSRPDIGASQQSVRIAQGRLDYQKGGRYPTLDFVGNYYPYRVGFLKDIDWDLTFTMNIPVFQGGATRGLIREAAAQLDQAKLSDSLTARQAEMDVRRAYDNLKYSRSQEAALRRAESKSGQSFQAQQDEYRLGLVNNLDVLVSLRSWQQQRLETNLAYFTTKLNYLNVLVASGDLPPKLQASE